MASSNISSEEFGAPSSGIPTSPEIVTSGSIPRELRPQRRAREAMPLHRLRLRRSEEEAQAAEHIRAGAIAREERIALAAMQRGAMPL